MVPAPVADGGGGPPPWQPKERVIPLSSWYNALLTEGEITVEEWVALLMTNGMFP
jgi:hypothetical protein